MADLKSKLVRLRGKRGDTEYLPVAARIFAFREDYPIPEGWAIRTEIVEGGRSSDYVTFRASVVDPEGRIIAEDYATQCSQDFAGGWLEKASTKAIGRALGLCGYGTALAFAEDSEGEVLADSPIEARPTATKPEEKASTPYADATVDAPGCETCGKIISQSQAEFGKRKWGKPLCSAHQPKQAVAQ